MEPPVESHAAGGDVSHTQSIARRRNRVIQSCLECRRRKKKCDRANYCQNCRASGQQCIYVPSVDSDAKLPYKLTRVKDAKDAIDAAFLLNGDHHGPPSVKSEQSRKRSRAPRDASADESQQSDSSVDDGYLEPTPLAVEDAAYTNGAADDIDGLGIMVGRMRLTERIGGLYRPWIADEIMSSLQHNPKRLSPSVQSIVGTVSPSDIPQPEPSSPASPSVSFIFGHVSPSEPLVQYIPPRSISDKLLEHYWIAVHPIVRILHRPTFAQRYETLWELIENVDNVAPSLVAIVCAILLSALTSMTDEQVLETCQVSRSKLDTRLKMGTELALSKAEVLKSSNTETIQAFVAYLLSICVNETSRAHSVLTGMAVRLAECMGLHRDPAEYGFSPAECQTRRLIWYQICYLDIKTSGIQGPRPFIHPGGYTTRLPFEVNSPMPLLPNASRACHDLIFSMVRFECHEMQRKSSSIRSRVDQKKLSLTKAISQVEAFRIAMDAKYSPFLSSASPSPLQKMTGLVMKLFTSLLYPFLLYRYMNSVTYRMSDRLRQIVLNKGTEALEAAVKLDSSRDLQHWAWYNSSYQQYHIAFLLLFEVFNFPLRREASRIWQCLDWIFADVLRNIPSLNTMDGNPTIQEIIAYRDVKARYLLTTISELMRKYQVAKGLKPPAQFKDSMIVVTPQKSGDDVDPTMPLNFAHGDTEEETGDVTLPIISPNSTAHHAATGRVAQIRSVVRDNSSLGSVSEWQYTLQHEGSSYIHSNNEASSQAWSDVISEQESADRTRLHSRQVRNDDSGMYHKEGMVPVGGEPETQEEQIIDIDWSLWDTLFPPHINDGDLDIVDNCLWPLEDVLDPGI